MKLFETSEELEARENILRNQVNALPDETRKQFYRQQADKLKDPDTYASLNWFFLGGIHHLYLGKVNIFLIEIALLILAVAGVMMDQMGSLLLLVAICLYELPQLFFSQKIARQHNLEISCKIYNDLR